MNLPDMRFSGDWYTGANLPIVMAEILGKDEATYSKERDSFLRDLRIFHDVRG